MENNYNEPDTLSIEQIDSQVSEIDALPEAPVNDFNDAQLEKYSIEGQYSLRNNDGESIYVDKDNLKSALTNPEWGLETKKQHDQRREYEQKGLDYEYYSSGPRSTYANAMALLNTVTGGWSEIGYVAADQFGEATGLWDFDNEEYAKIREANSGVTIVGEIGGLLNPFGWLNKPARAIHSVSKGVFTKVIGEATEGGFKKWGTKVLSTGGAGFLEHQAYQAKSYLNESLLTNTEMSSEAFFANQKAGSGWAFLIGGVAGGLPGAFKYGKTQLGKARNSLSGVLRKSNPSSMADDLFRSTANTGDSAVQNAKASVARDIIQDTVKKYGDDFTDAQLLKQTTKHSTTVDSMVDDIFSKLDDKIDDVRYENFEVGHKIIDDLDTFAFATDGGINPVKRAETIEKVKKFLENELPDLKLNSTKDLKKWIKTIKKKAGGSSDEAEIWKVAEDSAEKQLKERIAKYDPKAGEELALINTNKKVIEEFTTGLNKPQAVEKSALGLDGIGGDLLSGVIFDAIDGDFDLTEFLAGFGINRARSVGARLIKKSFMNRAKQYFRAQTVIDTTEEVINTSVKKSLYFKRPHGLSASAGFLSQTVFPDLPKSASKEDKIEYLTIKLDEYSSKTDMLEQRTVAGVSGYDKDFPVTAQGVIERQVKLVELLKSKIPRNPRSQVMDLQNQMNKRQWKPSPTDIRTFEKYLSAAVAPMTVLEDIANGRVSREQMETLEILYPEMSKYLVGSVINEVANAERPIPYQNRLKLSLVMGMPLDSSLEPATIRALQLLGTPQEKTPDTGLVSSVAPKLKPTQGGLNKLKIGSRGNSTLDAALNRGLE